MKSLIDNNFIVQWKGDNQNVYKAQPNGRLKKLGWIYDDESGVFFHSTSDDILPFKQGKNFFSEKPSTRVVQKPKKKAHKFTNSQFEDSTQISHTLLPYFKSVVDTPLINIYRVRGVKIAYSNTFKNYLAGEVVFPYYNHKNEFQSAKIIAYENGKRKKTDWSMNWFHAYKPIKKSLGITDRINKPKNCWFGEHLLGHSDNIAIVESEKTAVVFSEMFQELDVVFLATGSLGNLFSLDHSLLKGKNVTVFADKGVQGWEKEANRNGWYFDTTLEDSDLQNGDDILDALTTDLWSKVQTAIWNAVENKTVEVVDNPVTDALEFQYVPQEKTVRCFPNLFELKFRGYTDTCEVENQSAKPFEARYFNFYPANFIALSCNIDFNEWVKDTNGLWQPPSAEVFLERLEKLYRVGRFLNADAHKVEYAKTFEEKFVYQLIHLKDRSNTRFNINYVLKELVPTWNDNNDISEYLSKPRNWRIRKDAPRIKRKDFGSLLAEDRRIYSTYKHFDIIQTHIDQYIYISPKNALNLKQERDNPMLWNIVAEWNQKFIGTKTINDWAKREEIGQYLEQINPQNIGVGQKVVSPYNNIYIEALKNDPVGNPITVSGISKALNIPRKVVRKHMNFQPDVEVLNSVKTITDFMIQNPTELNWERIKTKRSSGTDKIALNPVLKYSVAEMREILDAQLIEDRNQQEYSEIIRTDNQELMLEPLNFKNGVFGCTEDEAREKGQQFYFEWICIHKNITGALEKAEVWEDVKREFKYGT